MPFDPAEQRKIMGCFATGVTIVTTRHEEQLQGMTANAVTSLSLEPPLVLVAIARGTQTHCVLNDSRCFALNILTDKQQDLSNRFATAGPKEFGDLDLTTAETGSPILKGSLAWVDCQVTEILSGGDHDIFIGEIVAGEVGDGEPLLYCRGKYGKLG